MRPLKSVLILLLTVPFFIGCQKQSGEPKKVTVRSEEGYAQCFKFDETQKVLSIFSGDSNSLLQSIKVDVKGPENNPIQKVALFSTTYLPMFEQLNQIALICAVDSARYSSKEWLQQSVKEGTIIEVGTLPNTDFERLLLSEADAIFAPRYAVSDSLEKQLQSAGIRCFFFQDWLESSPLGRAEWIKATAILLGCSQLGDLTFSKIEDQYLSLIKAKPENPIKVLTAMPWQGQWGIPGGHSYMAQLITDAGGATLWEETHSSGSLMLAPEAVLLRATKADLWLINSMGIGSQKDIQQLDPLYTFIPALKKGNIFNNSKKISPTGGNDYFETGALRPDLILSDLKAIIESIETNHTVKDDLLHYYEKLP